MKETEIKAQLAESVKLTKDMLDRTDGLQTKIDELEAKSIGTADLKEQMEKMAADNAKLIDDITLQSKKAADALNDRQDEFEAKFGRPSHSGADSTEDALEAAKALSESFAGKSRVYGSKGSAKIGLQHIVNRKTVTSLAASAGDNIVGNYETMITPDAGQQAITLLDFLPRSTTDQPIVYYVQETVASRTDNTGIQSLGKTGTGQGSALGESDFVFDQKSAESRLAGHTAKIAIQTLDDVPQLRAYIENQMVYMLRAKLESKILNDTGTGTDFNGINNQATAFDATLDSTVGVTNQQNLDVLRLAALQCANTHFPATGIVMHPTDVAGLELIKDSTGSYLFANPTSGNGVRPWGLPVVSSTIQTQDEFTVGAFNFAEVVFRRGVTVAFATENEDDFDKELATLKATVRAMLKVYRPTSLINGTFTAAKA